MEALKRTVELKILKEFELADGTKIAIRPPITRDMVAIQTGKLDDYTKGLHVVAKSILVNGNPIVYDDLLDCFSGDELILIMTQFNEVMGLEKNG